MQSVVLLLGSNHKQAADIVERAIAIVHNSVGEVVACSQQYRSEAFGFTSKDVFVNQAIEVRTDADAYEVLRRINLIEALLGRDRALEQEAKRTSGERYASRPIDIDIIFYGDKSFDDCRLVIPYHELDSREYALRPVAEIAGSRRHPSLALTPQEMLARFEK